MTVTRLEQRPGLGRLYAKAVVSARGRHGDRLPDATIELPQLTIDRDHLASYADVCGFRHSDILPATYPHLLAFPLAMSLMVDPSFPFALPGLIHVANRITQTRALRADERLSLRVWAADLREHPRGRQFDMLSEASLNGDTVWTESSTYLHRESSRGDSPSPARGGGQGGGFTSIWRVPRNVGRRYAAVSGDVNPIHLNPLAARLFGFRRAIAHGMWLKARCLAALEGRLPDALTAEVEFKSPLLLPSTVGFANHEQASGWTFAVAEAHSGRPHLNGSIQVGGSNGARQAGGLGLALGPGLGLGPRPGSPF
jgi:acyl dehydratase